VVLDIDGGIRALVGGRSYSESQFNRAVKARRQPGSAFKPFVYLAALESGLLPDSVIHDLPLSIDGWTPRNTNGRYQGAMPLRTALAESVNTVAVRLQFDIGARRVADVARRLGIRSELREDPSLALGTSEMSLIELTGAYGPFANGGALIAPHAIKRVRMSSGRVLYARGATRTEQVVTPVNAGAMNDMLNAALVSGTGRRAALSRHPAAGKTGTTSDFRDAVFVGYTAHFIGGVWTGNDNSKPMNRVMGGGLPAEIWREVMLAAHHGKAPLALPGTARALPQTDATAENDEAPEKLPWQRSRPAPAETPVAQPRDMQRLPAQVKAPADSPARRPLPPLVRVTPPPAEAATPRRSAASAAAKHPPSRAAHPKERIDAEFVARAIDDVPAAGAPAPALAGVPAGFDVDAIKNRLKASPNLAPAPPGMMTLGAPERRD
jgi:penicillin-binding protein 1A